MQTIFFNSLTCKLVNPLVIFLFTFLIYGCTESNSPVVEVSESTKVSGNITTDTVWDIAHSPYIAEGDITVEKNATLTLQPGVEVRFDGFYELIVKGVLIADGMTEIQQPEANNLRLRTLDNCIITFTSNNPAPEIKDWKGIKFQNTNDNRSLLRYIKVEYAKIGIDIFSSSPKIMHCFIMNNYRGIQSHSTKSIIINNLIKDNIIGISSEEREPDWITITKNIITQNETGIILFVGGTIKQNNLADNLGYAVRVIRRIVTGGQRIVNARYNWWGTIVIDDIEQQIYDNLDDPHLVLVSFVPFAKSPFTDAGPNAPLSIQVQKLENPRVEANEYPYEVIHGNLPKTLDFEP